jgi:hypothetical protein
MSAVTDLEKSLVKLNNISYVSVDKLMKKVAKDNDISTTELHHKFKDKHNMTPDDWIKTQIQEGNLHKWFKGSKSKDGKSGWVNVVTGGTCASDKPGEGTPKCVSSSKRSSMTPAERKSAQRRKKDADPNQQSKSGAAKPTYVSTDKPKKKMNEAQEKDHEYSMVRSQLSTVMSAAKRLKSKMGKGEGNVEAWVQSKITKSADYLDAAADYVDSGEMKVKEETFNEDSDKKGSGSGKKDACYKKVKASASVWPSAYASGRLVQCRKKGAANYGKSKNEEFMALPEMTDLQINAMRRAGIEVEVLDEKCWKGYKKKGMKTMFGKRYPNCVKEEEIEQIQEVSAEQRSSVERRFADRKANKEFKSGGGYAAMDQKGQTADQVRSQGQRNFEPNKFQAPNVHNTKTKGKITYGGSPSMTFSTKSESKNIELTDAYGETFATIETEEKVEELRKEVDFNTYDIESMTEAVRIPAKTGNIVMVNLGWKGKYYSIKMFFPQISKPSRKDVQDQIEKIYPGGKLYTFVVSNYEPGEPMLHAEGAAWTKKSGKSKSGGLNAKGRRSYEKENPGSDLKAPSKKVGNPRRASFCARMKGMKKKLTSKKTASDPDSRINKSLRAWNC